MILGLGGQSEIRKVHEGSYDDVLRFFTMFYAIPSTHFKVAPCCTHTCSSPTSQSQGPNGGFSKRRTFASLRPQLPWKTLGSNHGMGKGGYIANTNIRNKHLSIYIYVCV